MYKKSTEMMEISDARDDMFFPSINFLLSI